MARDHCPFRKTILGGVCACSLAVKAHLPTGCSVTCRDDNAWDRCDDLLSDMITAAQFTLQFVKNTDSMTHGKLLKIQHGGLLGLARLVKGEGVTAVDDIHALVTSAEQQYSSIQKIPHKDLLNDIAGWQLKRRHSK